MKQTLGKRDSETWRECVERLGAEWAISDEVVEMFDELVSGGLEEPNAAWQACFECEVLPVGGIVPEDGEAYEGSLT